MPRAKITVTSAQAWRDSMGGAAYASAERTVTKRLALNNISGLTGLVTCVCGILKGKSSRSFIVSSRVVVWRREYNLRTHFPMLKVHMIVTTLLKNFILSATSRSGRIK